MDLSNEDVWLGSYYELAIELSPRHDDERLRRALGSFWGSTLLAGPWRDRDSVLGAKATSTIDLSLDVSPSAYGLLRLREHGEVPCVICVVREEGDFCSDWLDVCVPTGALAQVFDVHYPLERKSNPWFDELDDALLAIADRIHRATAFDLAFIGEEMSGHVRASELVGDDANEWRERLIRASHLISARFNDQLRLEGPFDLRPSGLLWRAK